MRRSEREGGQGRRRPHASDQRESERERPTHQVVEWQKIETATHRAHVALSPKLVEAAALALPERHLLLHHLLSSSSSAQCIIVHKRMPEDRPSMRPSPPLPFPCIAMSCPLSTCSSCSFLLGSLPSWPFPFLPPSWPSFHFSSPPLLPPSPSPFSFSLLVFFFLLLRRPSPTSYLSLVFSPLLFYTLPSHTLCPPSCPTSTLRHCDNFETGNTPCCFWARPEKHPPTCSKPASPTRPGWQRSIVNRKEGNGQRSTIHTSQHTTIRLRHQRKYEEAPLPRLGCHKDQGRGTRLFLPLCCPLVGSPNSWPLWVQQRLSEGEKPRRHIFRNALAR